MKQQSAEQSPLTRGSLSWGMSLVAYVLLLVSLAIVPPPVPDPPFEPLVEMAWLPEVNLETDTETIVETTLVSQELDVTLPLIVESDGAGLAQHKAIVAQVNKLSQPAEAAQAVAWLKANAHAAVPLLKQLRGQLQPAAQFHLDQVLAAFDIKPIKSGLQIVLTADKQEVKPGDKVTFTTVIRNTHKVPMNLYVGYSTSGVAFESGTAFLSFAKSRDKAQRPQCRVGFCGTGAGPIFTTIPASDSIKYQMTVTFDPKPAKNMPPVPANTLGYAMGKYGYFFMPAPKDDVHRFVVSHNVTEANNQERGFRRLGNPDPTACYWVGTAVSNEVAIRVVN